MADCIFCKIINGEIPSFKIWEDKDHLAILDIFPNTRGMTLVMPKKHFGSYAFDMPEKDYAKLMIAARKVGKLLDAKLGTSRTAAVMEGMGVNHMHVKLYPMHGVGKEFKETWSSERAYFDRYPGHISTVLGPEADKKGLDKLAKLLKQ